MIEVVLDLSIIPYNKETQHLVGTNQDCPDKYKIW